MIGMNDDVERELEQIKLIVEEIERRSGNQDAGDDPGSSVPASLKPRPSRNSGAVALPEPEENAAEASSQKHDSVFLSTGRSTRKARKARQRTKY